jgi:DNA-binding NarL/FixJ family response regulator
MFRSDTYVYEAMRAGAHGYLLKSAHEGELIGAVRAVSRGGAFLPVAMRTVVLRRASLDARRVDLTLRMIRELA